MGEGLGFCHIERVPACVCESGYSVDSAWSNRGF